MVLVMKFILLVSRMGKTLFLLLGIAIGCNMDDIAPILNSVCDFAAKKSGDFITML